MLAPYERNALVFGRHIVNAVVFLHVVVYAFGGLLGVQFAQVAVLVAAVEVVYAERRVGSLLDFRKETAFAYAVDAPRRYEETVVGLDRKL